MNYYKATEKLLRFYTMLESWIENTKQEIKEIELRDGLNGISYEGDKISETHKIQRPTEEVAAKNIESKDLLEKKLEVLKIKMDKINNGLSRLSEVERQILVLYYMEGLEWIDIAFKIRYSDRHCKRIRNEAVNKLSVSIYGEEVIKEVMSF